MNDFATLLQQASLGVYFVSYCVCMTNYWTLFFVDRKKARKRRPITPFF
jgi:hypothetical protein